MTFHIESMPRHRVGDLIIASDLPLPEAPRAEPREPQCTFRLRPAAREPENAARDWFHRWTPEGGKASLSFAKVENGYLLRFHGLADFEVSAEGASIACQPLPGIPAVTLRHLLLDHVAPLVMSLRGRLVLHASAVLTPRGAVAFAGETGQGKSTLAASLARRGFALLADDCLRLEEETGCTVVAGSYPGLRLWPDAVAELFDGVPVPSPVAHYYEKVRIPLDSGDGTTGDHVPLWRLFLFPSTGAVDPTGVEIERLAGREAFVEILKRAYVLDVEDGAMTARLFNGISRLVGRTAVYRLNYPYDFSLLPRIGEVVTGAADPAERVTAP